jgi:protein SCO1
VNSTPRLERLRVAGSWIAALRGRAPLSVVAGCSLSVCGWLMTAGCGRPPSDSVATAPTAEIERSEGEAGRARIEGPGADAIADSSTRATQPGDRESDGPQWLTHFELTERSGEAVDSRDLLGEPYVVGFFFSRCPSICVRQNDQMRLLQEAFKDRPVRLVAISVDPEHDTPEVLRQYAQRFGADPDRWLFLTGELPYIRRVGAEMFSLAVTKQGHPERFVVVGADGQVKASFPWADPQQMKRLIQTVESLL